MVNEELREKVEKLGRMSDRMVAIVLVFEEFVLRLICGHAQRSK